MKFKIGDRVIILRGGETGIIIPFSARHLSLRHLSLGGQYRVKYDIPKKFGIATITSSLIWENNLELDIPRIRDEKINNLLL